MKSCLTLSLAAHLAVIGWAGPGTNPSVPGSFRPETADGVVTAELVLPPEPAATPPQSAAHSPEPTAPAPEPETFPTAPTAAIGNADVPAAADPVRTAGILPATPEGPSDGDARGKRLNLDFARLAWAQKVVMNTVTYQRNAPKGFEEIVRAALALHPVAADGTAKISFRNRTSGTFGVAIESDSPELKAALDRAGWDAAPLPTRYQIPCSGVDVTVSIAEKRLSVGVEIL